MGGMPQEKIEYGALQLQCALAVQSLLSFQTLEMPGEHARGIFRVRLEAGTDPEKFARSLQDIPVVLQIKGAEGITNAIPLFSGYPEMIRLFTYGEYQEAEITVLSGTVLLDRKRRNRVFQTLGQKYGDILGRVLKDTPDAAYIMTVQDSGTGVPFFQYEETDWEFLSRVTSRLGLALVADASHHYPRFYVGLRRGSAKEIPEDSIMAVSFDGDRFYEMERKGVQIAREDFFCYNVTTWANLELGERVQVEGRMLSVNRKEMILQDGEVVFHYCLAGESYALTTKKRNDDMIGITLYGEVQGTEGELCELTLDLESGQGGGYQYPFAPETGNLMYCMPQPGTKVCLSLGSGEESEGLVSGCIRENGAECEGTSDPSKRSFHTEYDKGLELYPDRMGLTGGTAGGLLLDDLTGTSLTSAANLVLHASGNIILDSGGILGLGALSGIFGGTRQEGCFCINDRFDYLASSSLLKGCDYLRYDPFDDAPRQGQFDWDGFWRNIAIGLAVVAVAAIAAAVVLATGGGAAVVFAAGAAVGPQMVFGACVGAAIGAAATTACIAIEDFNDGDVRSWEEATLSIVSSAISGAITGALGVRFPHMNKFLAGAIDTTLSTIERGVVSWFTMDMEFDEWLAYTFDWRQIVVDYFAGVAIDFLVDGIADRFRPEVTYSGLVDGFADDIGDGITREVRETMEDAMEEGLERTVRETTEETAERSARDMTEGVMDQLDDFDEYERFYRDMYDAQREINDAYEDFLEELRELQREGIGADDLAGILSEGGTPTLSGQWKTVNESMSDFSRAYQKQITGQEGMAWVQNGVKFDGMIDGVLLDAKGKYAQFINPNTGEFYGWFTGKQDLLDEAARQIKASEGAKIQWYFAEEEALDVVQDLFMNNGITEIELIFKAPK